VDELLAIGEFAAQSGLSAKMLRSYASAGLLVPAAVDRWSGYRYYAQSQLREAQLILWLRHAGVPLREIARFLDNPSAEQLRRWEQALDLETESRRSALAEVRDQLAASLTAGMEPAVAALVTPLQWGSTSLVGSAGNGNQDALLTDPPLFAVADGMGRSPGGQIASQLVLETLQACVTAPASVETLVQATRQAAHAVWQRIEADQALEGMGTTLTAAVALPGDAQPGIVIVSIGDSRAYAYTGGQLRQLTRDHSVVQGLIEAGRARPEEWRHHPQRHLLTRAIGIAATVEPDIILPPALASTRLLLCTDGLTAHVDEPAILAVLETSASAQQTASELARLAQRNGSTDDVTVVIIDLPGVR